MAETTVGILRILLTSNTAEAEAGFKKVSDATRQFADGFKSTNQQIAGLGTALNGVVGFARTLGPLVAAMGIGKLAGDFLQLTGSLVDLEAKTGISVTGLQRLKLATQEAGVELETVAAASVQLSKRLSAGQDSTVAAFNQLGLSYEQIRQLSPEDQFFAVADALGAVTDQNDRIRLTNELLGRQGLEILPALNGQLRETADAYERMGLVMNEATVRAGDKLGDQWTILKTQGAALLATVIGPLVPMFADLAEALVKTGNAAGPVLKFFLNTIGLPLEKTIFLVRDLKASFDLLRLTAEQLPTIKPPALEVPKPSALRMTLAEYQKIDDELTESAKQRIEENEQLVREMKRAADEAARYHALWSGATSFEEAQKLTKEIERLGGATKLTADEQQRALGTLQNAIDKYNALGQRAPAAVLATTIQLDAMVQRLEDASDAVGILGARMETELVPPPLPTLPMGTEGGWDLHGTVEEVRAITSETGRWNHSLMDTIDIATGIVGAIDSMADGLTRVRTNADAVALSFEGFQTGAGIAETLGAGASSIPIFGAAAGLVTLGLALHRRSQEHSRAQAVLRNAMGDIHSAMADVVGEGGDLLALFAELDLTSRFATVHQGTFTQQLNNLKAFFEEFKKRVATKEMRDELVKTYGSFERLQELAAFVGLSFQEAFDPANTDIEAFQDLIDEFEERLGEVNDQFEPLLEHAVELGTKLPASLEASLARLREMGVLTGRNADLVEQLMNMTGGVSHGVMADIAQRLGLPTNALGAIFNAQDIAARAASLTNDLATLIRGGGDIGGILNTPAIQTLFRDLVQDAITNRVALPSNLKQFIDELERKTKAFGDIFKDGELVDGALDLSKLEFGPEIEEDFQKNTRALENLVLELQTGALVQQLEEGGGLADALDNNATIGALNDNALIDALNGFSGELIIRNPAGNESRPDLDGDRNVAMLRFPDEPPSWFPTGEAPLRPVPIPGAEQVPATPAFFDRSEPGEGSRGAGGERNAPAQVVMVPVLVQQGADLDRVLEHVERHIVTDIALNRSEMRVGLSQLFNLAEAT